MAKFQADGIYDNGTLEELRRRTTRIVVCNAQPASYAAAISTTGNKLAEATGISSTEWTLTDGATSGRRAITPAKNGITIDASGTANHVALVGSTDSTLLLVTTATTLALTAGQQVNIPAFSIEERDIA